jgi:hypothetical protein
VTFEDWLRLSDEQRREVSNKWNPYACEGDEIVAACIRKLVLELARDNQGWGYTRIRDALRGLTIEIGRTTVANILAEAGIEPAPERNRKRTWTQFLKSHWKTLYACDFFSVETLGAFGTVRYMVFFVIEVKSRAVQIAGVRIAPDGDWMKQIARNLLDLADGFLRHASHLIVPIGSGGRGPLPIPSPHTTGRAVRHPAIHEARARRRCSARRLTRPMLFRAAFGRAMCIWGAAALRQGPPRLYTVLA